MHGDKCQNHWQGGITIYDPLWCCLFGPIINPLTRRNAAETVVLWISPIYVNWTSNICFIWCHSVLVYRHIKWTFQSAALIVALHFFTHTFILPSLDCKRRLPYGWGVLECKQGLIKKPKCRLAEVDDMKRRLGFILIKLIIFIANREVRPFAYFSICVMNIFCDA